MYSIMPLLLNFLAAMAIITLKPIKISNKGMILYINYKTIFLTGYFPALPKSFIFSITTFSTAAIVGFNKFLGSVSFGFFRQTAINDRLKATFISVPILIIFTPRLIAVLILA